MKVVIMLCILAISTIAHADSAFQEAYAQGKKIASQQQNRVNGSIQQFKPESVFNNFTNHPKEANEYGGVQQRDNSLQTKAMNESSINPVAKDLTNNFNNRPQFKIDAKAEGMKTSLWMINHANDLIHGKSCKKIPICETTYEHKICHEQPSIRWFYCKKRLQVLVDSSLFLSLGPNTHKRMNEVEQAVVKHNRVGI